MFVSWALIIILAVVSMVVLTTFAIVQFVKKMRRKAQAAGYASVTDYLNAVPHDDEEMRDAVDLALKGTVICLLGLLFPPFLLFGVVGLYYGVRKIAYSSLGLGLVDDAEPSA